jgi:hypothetical protein
MEFESFKASVSKDEPPEGLNTAAKALWWDAKGDWAKAHQCAQADDGETGAWVHAYLHRKEGDSSNAGYWYRRAVKPAASGSLEAEWEAIVRALLGER